MAYEIIGRIHSIGPIENIPTRNGSTLQRRSLILSQQRYDPNTGEAFTPNYPQIEFTQRGCSILDQFQAGQAVRVRFDVNGSKYNDKNTGEEKYFTSLRGFRVELYAPPQQQGYQHGQAQPSYAAQNQAAQGYQQPQQGYQQGAAPAAQNQQPAQGYAPQGGYNSERKLPF